MNIVPLKPKIYHIIHLDRLDSIIKEKFLYSDSIVSKKDLSGTMIGIDKIKKRRLNELRLNSNSQIFVGDCVPFYFCPRSIMLYLIHKHNLDETKHLSNGQYEIIHLQADLYKTIEWADKNNIHWYFTTSNAGSYYFKDYGSLSYLNKLNWKAINSNDWVDNKEEKQAEFLIETKIPFELIEKIGVIDKMMYERTKKVLDNNNYNQIITIKRDWYY